MSAVMGAVLAAAKWNSYGDFSRMAAAVATPPALVSSVCVIGLVVLSGHPITGTIIAASMVVGCSLAAIKSLCQQWYKSEPSQTFFKQVLNHVTSRTFAYGAIVGIGSFAELIAATRSTILKCPECTECPPLSSLTCEEAESGFLRALNNINKRINEGSIIVKDGPNL